ncbi:unnamed protein product [Brassica rapa subsp. trilocularis]
MQFSYGFRSGCWCCVCVSLFLVEDKREAHCHLSMNMDVAGYDF